MDIITLQNVAQIAELGTLQHGEGKVYSLAFSPDSRFLALGKSGNIELWQLSNRTLKGVLPFRLSVTEDIPFYPIADGVVFHPTGNYVVGVSGNTPRFSIWNVNDLRLEKEVTIPIGHQPRCVAITSSGKTIATGGMDGRVIFWDWNNNNPSLRSYLHAHDALSGDYAMIHSIEFSPDGLFMAIGCSNGEMRVWRVGFDLLYDIHTKMSGLQDVISLSFHGASSKLAVSSWGGDLHLLHLHDGRLPIKLNQAPFATNEQMFYCSFAQTEQLIASSQSSAQYASALLEFWDATTNTLLLAKPYSCNQVKFSPNGKLLAVIRTVPSGDDIPTIWCIPDETWYNPTPWENFWKILKSSLAQFVQLIRSKF